MSVTTSQLQMEDEKELQQHQVHPDNWQSSSASARVVRSSVLLITFLILLCVGLFVAVGTVVSSDKAAATERGNFKERGLDLVAGRQQLRSRMVNLSNNLLNHIKVLSSQSSRFGNGKPRFHFSYVEQFWRDLGLEVFNREYDVPASWLDPGSSIFICENSSTSAQANCSMELKLDTPLAQDDLEFPRSIYYFTKPLVGDFELTTMGDIKDPSLLERIAGKVVVLKGDEQLIINLPTIIRSIAAGFIMPYEPYWMLSLQRTNNSIVPYPNGTGRPSTMLNSHVGIPTWDSLFWVGDPTTRGYPSLPGAVFPDDGKDNQSSRAAQLDVAIIPITVADFDQLKHLLEENSTSSRFLRINWPMREGRALARDSCAQLRGSLEPDRVVVIGGHIDAWYGGAIDPHTGTATLLESARALAAAASAGGGFRRSLLFCSWDAEEQGLVGSIEWVEDELQRLGSRAVAYFNTDTDVMGDQLMMVQVTDELKDIAQEVLEEVDNPVGNHQKPYYFFSEIDASSDYYSFARSFGIPLCDMSYQQASREGVALYELYHSRYETPRLYRMLDPQGLAHVGVVKLLSSFIYTMAEAPLLPLNMSALAKKLENDFSHIRPGGPKGPDQHKYIVEHIKKLLVKAMSSLHEFQQKLEAYRRNVSALTDLQQRMINDKMMLVLNALAKDTALFYEFPINLLHANLVPNRFKDMPLRPILLTMVNGLRAIPKLLSDSFADG